jgi:hypothetical protein
MFELLKSQGVKQNQQVEFLSDGGEDVCKVQLYRNPQAELLLDWFRLTTRLTVLTQTAKGLPERAGEEEDQYKLRRGRAQRSGADQTVSVARQRVSSVELAAEPENAFGCCGLRDQG